MNHAEGLGFPRALVIIAAIAICAIFPGEAYAQVVPYDIVAVRMNRVGDVTRWPDVDNMSFGHPTKLVLIHPDGSEEVLDDPGPKGAIYRPVVSFDGRRVVYSKSPNTIDEGSYSFPKGGMDIYEMDLETRIITRLTYGPYTRHQTIPPLNETTGQPADAGIHFNLGPCYVPGPNGSDEIVFSSTVHNFHPTLHHAFHTVKARNAQHINYQLNRMDRLGRNVRPIDRFDTGDALDCEVRKNGWITYSSSQAQGMKSPTIWGLWTMLPDGRGFGSLFPGLRWGASYHFSAELTNGDLVATEYYNGNNFGFGALIAISGNPNPNLPPNGDADPNHPSNPLVQYGQRKTESGQWIPAYTKYTFSPQGIRNLSAFTYGSPDDPSPAYAGGPYAGKMTHPAAAPNSDLLVIYSPGSVNKTNPYVWGQIRLIKGGIAIDDPAKALLVKADSNYNYMFPRPVLPYKDIMGVERPVYIPYLPDAGTPFGYVGTSSMINRDTTPGTGIKIGNQRMTATGHVNLEVSMAWSMQGAEGGVYSDSDIYAIRLLAMDPAKRVYSGAGFGSPISERLRILGEFPVRKPGANGVEPLDGDGNPDTSWLAKIPADVPFTTATIDKHGMMLNIAQTWHQVRPGEDRHDCGGCHAHAHKATAWESTKASQPNYPVADLVNYVSMLSKDENGNTITKSYSGADAKRERSIDYLRDIRPILDRSCISCHTGSSAAGGLDLNQRELYNNYEVTYLCLTNQAEYGKPACNFDTRKYVLPMQARRSHLIWKIMGRRTDGLTNDTFPSPAGILDLRNNVDWDYNGTIMPPPDSGVPALTEEEKLKFIRWIDLGVPSDPPEQFKKVGYLADEIGPTLTIGSPRPQPMKRLEKITFGAYDYYSGVDTSKFSVKATFTVNGKPPGTELFPFFRADPESVFTLDLAQPIDVLDFSDVEVIVFDKENNATTLKYTFRVGPDAEDVPPTATPRPKMSPTPTGNNPGGPNGPGGVATPTPVPGSGGNRAPQLSAKFSKKSSRLSIACLDDALPNFTDKSKKGSFKGSKKKTSRVRFTVFSTTAQGKKRLKKWSVVMPAAKKYRTAMAMSEVLATSNQGKPITSFVVQATDGSLKTEVIVAVPARTK